MGPNVLQLKNGVFLRAEIVFQNAVFSEKNRPQEK
jgi:hypothetical protein